MIEHGFEPATTGAGIRRVGHYITLPLKSTRTGHVKGQEYEEKITKTFCEEAKTASLFDSLLEVMLLKRTSTLLQSKYKPDQISFSSNSIETVYQTAAES